MSEEMKPIAQNHRANWRVPLLVAGCSTALVVALAVAAWGLAQRYGILSFTTDDLIVNNTSVLTGRTSVRMMNASPANTLGGLAAQTILSNWAPANLQTGTLLVVQASDNTGSTITGIDATGISVGDIRTICNLNGQSDDAVVTLTNLDTRSLVANRIFTPGAGIHTTPVAADFYIGPDECSNVMYALPDASDATFKAWIVVGSTNRTARILTQSLQFYPVINPPTITGTINNYAPVDNFPYVCAPGAVGCGEAGNRGTGASNTMIFLSTTDASGAIVTGLAYTAGVPEAYGPVKVLVNNGPGPVTLKQASAGSSALNQFGFSTSGGNEYDIVMAPGGAPVFLYHVRDTGRWIQLGHNDYVFGARDVTMQKGVTINGGGASGVGSIALLVDAAGVGVRFGNGNTLDFDYHKTADFATSGPASVGGTLVTSGGAFTGGNKRHVCSTGSPTVNHGTLDTTSTNCIGAVSAVGANTSVTLTFGADSSVPAPNTAVHCYTQIEGAGIVAQGIDLDPTTITAPMFNCFTLATGVAANCPAFAYQCWWN